jgi:hypothetical protein
MLDGRRVAALRFPSRVFAINTAWLELALAGAVALSDRQDQSP